MKREATIVLVVALAVMLMGQILAYYVNSTGFSISSETEGGTIEYTVTSDSDVQYTELHLKDTSDTPSKFYVLRDPTYAIMADRTSIEPTCYFLEMAFDRYGSISMEYKTVAEILDMVESDISSGAPETGLIIFGGALPQPLYDGTSGSKIVQWLNAGGHLYWCGGQFGRYISTTDGVGEVENYHTTVCSQLFGAEYVFNDLDTDTFATQRINSEFTELSGMYYANIRWGADVSKLSDAHLDLGYSDGQHVSAVIMKYGSGALCTFGGYVNYQEVEYMAHVLFLGLTYSTEIAGVDSGSIRHNEHSGSFEESTGTSHFVILHDVRWYRGWAYDVTAGTFE